MAYIRRRLEKLEAKTAGSEWVVPIEVRLLLKEIDRDQAARAGHPLPEYIEEEWTEHLCQEEEFADSALERQINECLKGEGEA